MIEHDVFRWLDGWFVGAGLLWEVVGLLWTIVDNAGHWPLLAAKQGMSRARLLNLELFK